MTRKLHALLMSRCFFVVVGAAACHADGPVLVVKEFAHLLFGSVSDYEDPALAQSDRVKFEDFTRTDHAGNEPSRCA